jgi:hypothetical protein
MPTLLREGELLEPILCCLDRKKKKNSLVSDRILIRRRKKERGRHSIYRVTQSVVTSSRGYTG